MNETKPVGVLFICYANICRSPLAEAVFRNFAEQRGVSTRFHIDSAGTGAAEGYPPHRLSIEAGARKGIEVIGRSRTLAITDFFAFQHMLVMDRDNAADVTRLQGLAMATDPRAGRVHVRLLRQVADPQASGTALDVPDPIGAGHDRYQLVFAMLERSCAALLDELTTDSRQRR